MKPLFKSVLVFAAVLALSATALLVGCAGHHVAESAGGSAANANATLHFAVTGMTCEGCSGGLRSELLQTAGVAKARVDHKTGKAVVNCDTNQVSAATVIKVIEEAGFKAKLTGP